MADLFLSDISVLLPDGAVADHQDVSVESGRFQSIRPHQGPDGAVLGARASYIAGTTINISGGKSRG